MRRGDGELDGDRASTLDGGVSNLDEMLGKRKPGRIHPSLDRIRAVLQQLDNPQRELRSILVVGTNGKGSTAAMLSAILDASGLVVGLYTSPHLYRVTERIRVAGHEIPAERLCAFLGELDHYPELTYFEALTVAALLEFRHRGVDVAVLEAGMGGRWDATRAAGSVIAGLTNIGTDHRRWLGPELEDIAADKGAALAAAKVAIRGPGVSESVIAALGAPDSQAASSWVRLEPTHRPDVLIARWPSGLESELGLPLAGHHQVDNLHLALALAAAAVDCGWCRALEQRALRAALASVKWPGRCEEVNVGGRTVLLDGAHNLEGCRALASFLAAGPRRRNLVFSCLDDKPVEAMSAVLEPVVGDVVVFELEDERAMPAARLTSAFRRAGLAANATAALAQLSDPVVVAGSLRLAWVLTAPGGSQ